MATVCAKVFKHHQKTDGTYNVKIRVFHKSEVKWIDTTHYITDKQLSKKLIIKDPFVNKLLNETLNDYRLEIGKLGKRLDFFNCENVRDHLITYNEDIDFIRFCDKHIKRLYEENREGTAANHKTVRNSLVDFFKRNSVSIMEINLITIKSFERFLRGAREITRINQGKLITKTFKGLTDKGVHNMMRDLRTLFNEARAKYNNEDLGLIKIPHYPFKKYKLPNKPVTRKRNHSVEQIRTIQECELPPNSRVELLRDLYILSFCLCGINSVDLYHLEDYKGNRIEYNRAKTKGQRMDNAFISIRIPEIIKPLLDKYLGQLKLQYSHFRYLDKALSVGSRELSKITKIPDIGFYWARGSFANIARNKCKVSKDDIALALNHVDEGTKVTDIYIEKDWSIIDDVQNAVINYTFKMRKKKKK